MMYIFNRFKENMGKKRPIFALVIAVLFLNSIVLAIVSQSDFSADGLKYPESGRYVGDVALSKEQEPTVSPTATPTTSPRITPKVAKKPTATPTSQSVSVVVFGDTRTGHDIHQKLVNLIINRRPSAVFHVGDLVEDGTIAEQWTTFNNITSVLRASIPFYPVLGNHEKNATNYYNNFSLPNNERWYAVDLANLHAIMLDSNASLAVGSEQYNYLKNELQSAQNAGKHIIVVFHHPPYSTGSHTEDEKGLRTTVVPLFEQYGVKFVFNGHDHDYERSQNNGVYYIVTGGGGAPLYDQSRTRTFSQKFIKTYEYTIVSTSDNTIQVKVYNVNNTLIDEISATK